MGGFASIPPTDEAAMRKGIGIVLIAMGLLLAVSACTNAKRAPNLGCLMGTYLPSILLLAVGVKLRQEKSRPASMGSENPLPAVQVRRKSSAEMGVLGGIFLMFMGSGLSQHAREVFLLGTAVFFGGWGLMIWGAANYMRWKGYSAWLALLGLLLLPGLIILACFPNKMKNIGSPFQPETKSARSVLVVVLVAVVLLIALPMAAFLALPFMLSQLPRAQTASAWATLSSDPPKFTVDMPANPKRQATTQQSPDGASTVTTYAYESHDDIATYTAGFMPFAPDPKVGMPQKVAEEVLDTMLDNTASAMKGQVLYRKSISLGPHFGREQTIEFTPGVKNRAGEPIVGLMVWKLYFVRDSIVMLTVTLPKNAKGRPRMDGRMARFFDSIKVE
jgi:hypothetical protein